MLARMRRTWLLLVLLLAGCSGQGHSVRVLSEVDATHGPKLQAEVAIAINPRDARDVVIATADRAGRWSQRSAVVSNAAVGEEPGESRLAAADGRVYVAFTNYTESSVRIVISKDGGRTFGPSRLVAFAAGDPKRSCRDLR